MADERIRRQVALLAARLMYERQESEYFTAKRKAARQLGVEYKFRPGDLPSNREIRDQIQALANVYEGSSRTDDLRSMRLEALRMMRLLAVFRPRQCVAKTRVTDHACDPLLSENQHRRRVQRIEEQAARRRVGAVAGRVGGEERVQGAEAQRIGATLSRRFG